MTNLAENRQARFDYEILEKFSAGIVLTGQEVKSAKNGGLNLKGAFVTFQGTRAFLTNAHIAPYPAAGPLPDYDPTRSRALLLKKREMRYLREKSLQKGLTIVPLRVYTNNHLIKVEIALSRGKAAYDKRAAIKKRDVEREIRRATGE